MIIEYYVDPETCYLLECKKLSISKEEIFKRATKKYLEKAKNELQKDDSYFFTQPSKASPSYLSEEILEVFQELGFTEIKPNKRISFGYMKIDITGYEDVDLKIKEKMDRVHNEIITKMKSEGKIK